jgi:galactokinase
MALARAAREHGALAASSFGAGFGGSVWALVDRDAADDFATRWHPGAFVAQPGPPLTEF